MTNLQILLLAALGLFAVSNLLFLTGLSRGVKGNTKWLQKLTNDDSQAIRKAEGVRKDLEKEQEYSRGLYRMIQALLTRVQSLENQLRLEQINNGISDAEQGHTSSLDDVRSRVASSPATHHRGDKQVRKASIEPGYLRTAETIKDQNPPPPPPMRDGRGCDVPLPDDSPSRSSSCSSGSSWGGDSSSSSSSSSSSDSGSSSSGCD